MVPFSEKLKNNIKKELIDYYEIMKFEIDIKSQKLLITDKNNLNLMNSYLQLIEKVELIFSQNMDELNKYFEQNATIINENEHNSENIKSNALSKYCTFINSDFLKPDIKDNYKIGIFIECDWYLNKNQINYLKVKFEDTEYANQNEFSLDEDVLNIMYAFKDTKNIIGLNLNKNKIKNELSNLSKLNLVLSKEEKNLIKKIENNAFINLNNLKEFSLCDSISFMNTLHAGELLFNGLNKLQVLNLHLMTNVVFMNEITKNNSWLNLNYLKELNISNNEIKLVKSTTFKELTNLETLFLIDCSIQHIEMNAFRHLKNLKTLNLSHNDIKSLKPDTFTGLDSLTKLNIAWSSIEEIEPKTFNNLNTLIRLDLSYNNLKKLDQDTFQGLVNLKYFYMSNYQLRTIEKNTFKHLKSLRNLDLSNNKIEILKENCFYGLNSLIELNLSTGCISIIEMNALKFLKNLRSLYIYGNPINILDKNRFKYEHGLKSLERINFKRLIPYKNKRNILVLKFELALLVYYFFVFLIRLIFY